MRVRTFVTLLLLLGLAAAVVFLLLPNRTTLELTLTVGRYAVPVWGAILGAFTIGALFGLVFELLGAGRGIAARARSVFGRRRLRAAERALELGRRAEREGRLGAAIEHFREATALAPLDPRGPMRLGDALRQAGRPVDAAAAHEQARRVADEPDASTHALALDHIEAGRWDDARRELEALVARSPRTAVAPLRQLRDIEMRAGNWEAAARAQRRLEAATGELTEDDRERGLAIRTELARARAEAGQRRAALNQLRRVVKEAPAFLPAVNRLAELLVESGDVGSARTVLLEAFERTGEPVLLDRLADIDIARERPQDAIATLRGLVAGRRHAIASRFALGRLYFRLEMLDEAADQLEPLHEELPAAVAVTVLLARTEERRGRLARAAALYREALEARPVPESLCRACGAAHESWAPSCRACGRFGTVSSAAPLEPRRDARTPQAPGPLYELAAGES
ncbi:MAG: hypothetical protein D6718_13310 [Acidobacteria bacterium]|nr:MAG: hypothetical protein D6718_13310 [Acidobacteriota bacterium]